MTTTVTAAEALPAGIEWHDDVETLEKIFVAGLGRQVVYTRDGELAYTQFGGETVRWLHRLITETGTLTHVERSANGVSLSLTIGGIHTSVRGRHPVADATRFVLTIGEGE